MYALLKSHSEAPKADQSHSRRISSVSPMKPGISNKLRRQLLYMHVTSFDWEQGGLDLPIKFIDRDSIEYSLTQAAGHDRNEARMARKTLLNALALIDPVWGGIYQFSTRNRWDHPHYAKTMAAQAGCLRIYSLAYALMHEHAFLIAARRIRDYLKDFLLSPEGAFYTAQTDAPEGIDPHGYFALPHADRIEHGIPAVDNSLYSKENAWAVEALASFYEFTGEHSALTMAIRAADWVVSKCRLPEGGYRHGANDHSSPVMTDTLAVGRAMLQLYRVTTDRRYLRYATDAGEYIAVHFKCPGGGYNNTVQRAGGRDSAPQIDDNICATRFFNLLHHYSTDPRHRRLAGHGLCYLAVPQVATARMEEAGILLVDEEYSTKPVRITIVGDKSDPQARRLHEAALHAYGWYKVVKWLEPGTEEHKKQDYTGNPKQARAYIKTEDHISTAVIEPEKLMWLIKNI